MYRFAGGGPAAAGLALAVAAVIEPTAAATAADRPHFGRYDVPSVFRIEKNENRNQVHYGVRLDRRCRPLGAEPVYPYWRELEEGPEVLLALSAHERPAYGIRSQRVQARVSSAGRVRMRLEALAKRPVDVESYRGELGDCEARATTSIAGRKAVLRSVYVAIAALFSVDHIVLRGETFEGRSIEERIER